MKKLKVCVYESFDVMEKLKIFKKSLEPNSASVGYTWDVHAWQAGSLCRAGRVP
jgi:hypothetical protein